MSAGSLPNVAADFRLPWRDPWEDRYQNTMRQLRPCAKIQPNAFSSFWGDASRKTDTQTDTWATDTDSKVNIGLPHYAWGANKVFQLLGRAEGSFSRLKLHPLLLVSHSNKSKCSTVEAKANVTAWSFQRCLKISVATFPVYTLGDLTNVASPMTLSDL